MSEHESDSNVATFIGISLVFALVLFFGTTEIYGNDFNGDGKTEMLDIAWMIPVFPIIAFVAILLFGHYDPRKGGSFALVGIGLSSVFSLAIAYLSLIHI